MPFGSITLQLPAHTVPVRSVRARVSTAIVSQCRKSIEWCSIPPEIRSGSLPRQALRIWQPLFKDRFNLTGLSRKKRPPSGGPQLSSPNGSGRPPPRLLLALLGASALGLLMGIAIQTGRFGGSLEIISTALAKPTLQQAERAFRNGEDDTAVADFRKLADRNNPTAQY